MQHQAHNIQATITQHAGEVRLHLKVVPNASRTRIVGLLGARLKVQVAAPPEAGKANKAVCQMIAKTLGVPKKQVEIVTGAAQPEKVAAVVGLTVEQVIERLGKAIQ